MSPLPFTKYRKQMFHYAFYTIPKILQAERNKLLRINYRKRRRSEPSTHAYYSAAKRRRPLPSQTAAAEDSNKVVLTGVPMDCSMLKLVDKFMIYGPISRAQIEMNGVAHISFASNFAAQSAVDDSPITLNSVPVQVQWASDLVLAGELIPPRKEGDVEEVRVQLNEIYSQHLDWQIRKREFARKKQEGKEWRKKMRQLMQLKKNYANLTPENLDVVHALDKELFPNCLPNE